MPGPLVPLPDLTMRQLEYLVAIADVDTWSAAAERVGVSASALSQGLAELERRVGVALFEPAGRRRVLRPAATPVLHHARQVVGLTRDLVEWSDRVRSGRHGRVRIGMIDIAAVVHFPGVLRAMRAERPDVELLLSVAPSAPLLDDLRDGELDVVVCVEPPTPRPGLRTEPLLDEALAVIAPPGGRIGPPDTWGPWLVFPAGSHTRQLVELRLRQLGAHLRIEAESHQPEVLVQMVALGLGWSVLPIRQARAEGEIAIGPEIVHRRLVLATREGSTHDPAADDLAGRLRAA